MKLCHRDYNMEHIYPSRHRLFVQMGTPQDARGNQQATFKPHALNSRLHSCRLMRASIGEPSFRQDAPV